ncbi:MAG: hypothetical protein RLZZ200_1491 [Pseudomonadota bacterium]
MGDHVRVGREGAILTLVLARPEKKNALTAAMYRSLADAIESAQSDDRIHVIALTGDGDLFSAGNDVGDFIEVARHGDLPPDTVRFLRLLAGNRKPLVAGVQGRAVGVGMTLLLHCDYVVLADDALLSAPFVNLALVPEAASSLLLPARIGHPRAFSVFALGEVVDAAKALVWGLANEIVPRAGLGDAVRAVAGRLARQPLEALLATKALMRPLPAISEQMTREFEQFMQRLASEEARAAFAAFLERRPTEGATSRR